MRHSSGPVSQRRDGSSSLLKVVRRAIFRISNQFLVIHVRHLVGHAPVKFVALTADRPSRIRSPSLGIGSIMKTSSLFCVALLCGSQVASAQSGSADGANEAQNPAQSSSVSLRDIPLVAYTYSASGASFKTVGVQGYGIGMAARAQDSVIGGGGTFWASPLRRLTFVLDAQRNAARAFTPSAAAIVSVYASNGFSLGALGKFKVDGFAAGPDRDEVESEIEVGGLVSYDALGWYADVNAMGGRGTGDDGETDVEGRLRAGRAIARWLRLGVDSQVRARLAGPKYLPNGRTWDFVAGAQAIATNDAFFGSLTVGPTTTGLVTKNVGWTIVASLGGVVF